MVNIKIRTPEEIEKIAVAGKIVASFFEELRKIICPGMKTIEIDALATEFCRDHGGIPVFRDVKDYYHSTCVSINEQIVHGIPGKMVIKEGDLVKIDFGVKKNGYIGDSCISIPIGEISPKAKKLLEVTEKSLYLAIESAIVGNKIGDIGYAIQRFVERHGFSVVREFVGHGVGTDLHELPSVPHFGRKNTGLPLEEGMILAIEPMINIGTWKARILSDGWTAVTMDGKWSAQFEHTIAVTASGPKILTQ